MRISDRKTLIKVLRAHDFALIRTKTHDIYSNGSATVPVPKTGKRWSRILAEKICKEAGIR